MTEGIFTIISYTGDEWHHSNHIIKNNAPYPMKVDVYMMLQAGWGRFGVFHYFAFTASDEWELVPITGYSTKEARTYTNVSYWIWRRRKPLIAAPNTEFFNFGMKTISAAHNDIRGENGRNMRGQLLLKFYRPETASCEGNYHPDYESDTCVENVCNCKNGLGEIVKN